MGEISGVFVSTWPGEGKYPVEDWENLQLRIQMQIAEKRNALFQFSVLFLESTSNFKHFETKDDGHS